MNEHSLPDPSGEPRAVERGSIVSDALTILAVGGICLVILSSFMRPTMGASRSAHLKWEERKHQMEEAEKAASARDVKKTMLPAGTGHD